MFTVDSSKVVVDLDGKPLVMGPQDASHFSVGKALGNILCAHKGARMDHIKLLELARKFHTSAEVKVDKSDYENLKEIVKADQNYTALINGQVMEALVAAKEDEKVP